LVPSWLCWLFTVHPRIELDDEALVIVNWFVKYSIPWALIESVDIDDGLRIVLSDRRVLRPVSGSWSLASALRGNDISRAMASAIAKSRKMSDPGPPTRSRIRLDLDARVFIPVALVLLVIAWVSVR
jgi:hypothetical protein